MTTPPESIVPLAVYTREQAAGALGIGDTKLRDLVAAGHLRRLTYTGHWHFWGEDLIELCRAARGPATEG